jgi:hypothetical protein
MISLPVSRVSFSPLGFPVLPLTKKFGFYKLNCFCLEIQLWFLETEIFLKLELEKFRFLRTGFFINGKIEFFWGKKESWGLKEKFSFC